MWQAQTYTGINFYIEKVSYLRDMAVFARNLTNKYHCKVGMHNFKFH